MDPHDPHDPAGAPSPPPSAFYARESWQIFLIFLRLGLASFGGPIAHLGYFRTEFVVRRRWLDEAAYADLVALCQFLPGPASSQVGMALGMLRAGARGALAAWAGFTLPSALALIVFARTLTSHPGLLASTALHGLKIAAVAVVAQAVWGMARTLCTDLPRRTLMVAAACAALLLPGVWTQIGIIVLAALFGVLGLRAAAPTVATASAGAPVFSARSATLCLILFAVLLFALPLVAALLPTPAIRLVDAFYRAGALVFGGGHVVLPLLQAEVVATGWVDEQTFLAGYGAAQAVPGPLFTFAAFLGASLHSSIGGWGGGVLALLAIFLPSFMLVAGTLPFWHALRGKVAMRAALSGVNAAVVGLLLAALYDPVWTSAILRAADFALLALAVLALLGWKWPPWLVVAGCAVGGWVLAPV